MWSVFAHVAINYLAFDYLWQGLGINSYLRVGGIPLPIRQPYLGVFSD